MKANTTLENADIHLCINVCILFKWETLADVLALMWLAVGWESEPRQRLITKCKSNFYNTFCNILTLPHNRIYEFSCTNQQRLVTVSYCMEFEWKWFVQVCSTETPWFSKFINQDQPINPDWISCTIKAIIFEDNTECSNAYQSLNTKMEIKMQTFYICPDFLFYVGTVQTIYR